MGSEPIRVVLVDDSVPVRAMLRQTLEDGGGFEIVGEAASGREGIDLAVSESPDVVVLDLAMPGVDGLDAIPLLRERAPGVKIVVLSLAGRSMQAEALAVGAHAYFGKNEPIESLVMGLKGLFARS